MYHSLRRSPHSNGRGSRPSIHQSTDVLTPNDREVIEKDKLQNLKPDYRPPLRSKKSQNYVQVSAGLRHLPPNEAPSSVDPRAEDQKDLVHLSKSELVELNELNDDHLNKIAE